MFTDVEGSTRQLQELGAEAYARELARHRKVVREAVAAEGGVEVDTQGDAFFVAFPTAPGALRAAERVTERLAAGRVRVRIGVHTGTPHVTEEGYVGEDVHRAARIAAAGSGGQVLVSAATAALVGVDGLLDLGEHRFKDLSAPERVFQFGAGDFRPLDSLYATNLPVPTTPFLGREAELAEVVASLSRPEVRMLTLTGSGGTGKTRLALQAAGRLSARYPDGVWWVPLAALREPRLVLETAAQTFGASGDLAAHIGGRAMLLLFDNFEHLIEAAADVAAVLASCPRLELVVTSRQPLRVSGEYQYAVPSLAHAEAVELFVARANAVRPGFRADQAVSEVCDRLDDLPLALELAAARVKALSATQILARLEQRLPLLTGGPRDHAERQRTLRATIEWSYELLGADEREVFARLAVFRGGCTLEAAEEVASADIDLLGSLVDKNLLRQSEDRFWMLETIREYAAEQLDESDEADELRWRHAEHFLALAEQAESTPGSAAWLRRIERERDNYRAAFETLRAAHDTERLARLAYVIMRYLPTPAEQLRWVDVVLPGLDSLPGLLRAHLLRRAGFVSFTAGDPTRSVQLMQESLAAYERLGDRTWISRQRRALGTAVAAAGDPERARALVEQSLAEATAASDTGGMSNALHALGEVELAEGNLDRAASLLERSAHLAHQSGNDELLLHIRHGQADVALERGDLREARRLYRATLESMPSPASRQRNVIYCLAGLAAAAATAGDCERAGYLWGAKEGRKAETGWRMLPTEDARYQKRIAGCAERAPLVFAAAAERGRATSLEQATEYALADDTNRG
jgi:predicted ATPase